MRLWWAGTVVDRWFALCPPILWKHSLRIVTARALRVLHCLSTSLSICLQQVQQHYEWPRPAGILHAAGSCKQCLFLCCDVWLPCVTCRRRHAQQQQRLRAASRRRLVPLLRRRRGSRWEGRPNPSSRLRVHVATCMCDVLVSQVCRCSAVTSPCALVPQAAADLLLNRFSLMTQVLLKVHQLHFWCSRHVLCGTC
jgi:hypothetical protein